MGNDYSRRGASLVQTRVMSTCPVCGLRSRVDRLLDVGLGVVDNGDLLPLTVAAVYAEYPGHRFRCRLRPVNVAEEAKAGMYRALAAKLLPLVVYLRAVVPEFDAALTEVLEVTTIIEQPVRRVFEGGGPIASVQRVPLDAPISRSGEIPIPRERVVQTWVGESGKPMERRVSVVVEQEVPVERVHRDST